MDKLIDQIRKSITKVPGRQGVVLDEYTTTEVGIDCYHYEVAGIYGIHSGHWTDPDEIPNNENQIVAAILEEDADQWDGMSEDELSDWLHQIEASS